LNILSGYPPFVESSKDLGEQIKRGSYSLKSKPWNWISQEAKELIHHLMDINPKTRFSAAQALQSKWFVMQKEDIQ
jgi:calcium-dependent protein kinase